MHEDPADRRRVVSRDSSALGFSKRALGITFGLARSIFGGIKMLWTILVIVLIVLVVLALFGRGRLSR